MASISLVQHIYTNPETLEQIPYKRLAISGTVGTEEYTLELKLIKTELMGAQMILDNAEGGVLNIIKDGPF